MTDDIAISVKDVDKIFKVPHQKHTSIKSLFVGLFRHKKGHDTIRVLDNISFEVNKGEFFGIVGRNGSGKSTLLKLLAGIYSVDKGTITIEGKLTPFIELGVGFNQELTGRENVYLNGALLGFSRKEMEEMYEEIVQFAELEKFMDQKLKNYSSGMQVRLAFSIAIRAKTEILLIEEVLAVGDVAFQKKCYAVFQALKREGRTVVFVTHGMGDVERFCDRVLVLDKSRQIGIYDAHKARVKYEKLNQEEIDKSVQSQEDEARWGTGLIKVSQIQLSNGNMKNTKKINPAMPTTIDIGLELVGKPRSFEKNVTIGLNIFSENGENLFGPNTIGKVVPMTAKNARLQIPELPLNSGKYYITVAIFDEKAVEVYDHLDRSVSFTVDIDRSYYGVLDLEHSWEIIA